MAEVIKPTLASATIKNINATKEVIVTNKDHKKLESFHLTEDEKKALRDQDRAEFLGELIMVLSAIAIALVIVLVIMELATR